METLMTANTQRIDTHHHFLPPEFVAHLARRKIEWTGGPLVPDWNVSIAREVMERNGIAAAVASVIPEIAWGDVDNAPRWARHCNDYSARIVHDDPQHFGAFATLPIPDMEASLREVEYALDELGFDGIVLFTSNDARYLGDPLYEELLQELDRRSAVVFVHPNTFPPGSDVPKIQIPYGLTEFVFDTTRCIANLLFTGALERYPSIRWIFSHGGGTVPYIAGRLALSKFLPEAVVPRLPKGINHYLQRLHYDTALSTTEYALAAMRQFVPTSQILFGSDYPMVTEPVVQLETSELESSKVLDTEAREAIYRGNAMRLFPRFAGQPGK